MSALHLAARAGDAEKIVALLADPKTDPNAADGMSRTALHLAAWAGSAGAIEALLAAPAPAKKANINAKAKDNFTPLHFAVQGRHLEAAEMLVRCGKSAIQLDAVVKKGGKTALQLAASKANLPMVAFLLEAGASATVPMADLSKTLVRTSASCSSGSCS